MNSYTAAFDDGLEEVILGIQSWIRRYARDVRTVAETEAHPQLRENLRTTAGICERLVTDRPQTFREACQ